MDLDETLIHCDESSTNYTVKLNFPIEGGGTIAVISWIYLGRNPGETFLSLIHSVTLYFCRSYYLYCLSSLLRWCGAWLPWSIEEIFCTSTIQAALHSWKGILHERFENSKSKTWRRSNCWQQCFFLHDTTLIWNSHFAILSFRQGQRINVFVVVLKETCGLSWHERKNKIGILLGSL